MGRGLMRAKMRALFWTSGGLKPVAGSLGSRRGLRIGLAGLGRVHGERVPGIVGPGSLDLACLACCVPNPPNGPVGLKLPGEDQIGRTRVYAHQMGSKGSARGSVADP
jgi:hypothetical protein